MAIGGQSTWIPAQEVGGDRPRAHSAPPIPQDRVALPGSSILRACPVARPMWGAEDAARGRPWSTSTGASARPTAARKSATSARSRPGVWTLRWRRRSPRLPGARRRTTWLRCRLPEFLSPSWKRFVTGPQLRSTFFFSAEKSETGKPGRARGSAPRLARGPAVAAGRRRANLPVQRSTGATCESRVSILLDDALAAGGLRAAAELVGIARGFERPHHGAVIDTLGAEIGASHDRLAVTELAVGLQAAKRGLRRPGSAPAARRLQPHSRHRTPGARPRRAAGVSEPARNAAAPPGTRMRIHRFALAARARADPRHCAPAPACWPGADASPCLQMRFLQRGRPCAGRAIGRRCRRANRNGAGRSVGAPAGSAALGCVPGRGRERRRQHHARTVRIGQRDRLFLTRHDPFVPRPRSARPTS